ncbi:unnamed protein product [Rotaria magnacalcarata]|uniref:Uncharacterized protein n=2 Tax=Rotaria magnacalcarata TaxID=392030 RepID=A0A815V1Y2_9BILA|nr:unnamed protein product [Rotaria magnacalcarata]CAF4351067.1 unnamed protein product [Rotaria magnacalcarata]
MREEHIGKHSHPVQLHLCITPSSASSISLAFNGSDNNNNNNSNNTNDKSTMDNSIIIRNDQDGISLRIKLIGQHERRKSC